MASYAITGVSRGIGLEYVRQISSNPSNTVVALVRNPDAATQLASLASQRGNIHVLKADVTEPQSLLDAADAASKITDGKIDVLIHNAVAYDFEHVGQSPSQMPFDKAEMRRFYDQELSTGLYGAAWTTNAFLPLIEKGTQKKVIHISSAMAELALIKGADVASAVGYSVAKAAMNVLVAKYAVELAPKGIKILAVSPGWVDTFDEGEKPTEMAAWDDIMLKKFQRLDPNIKGRIPREDSVRMQLEVVDKLDAELSGQFVSHHGDQQWW